MSSTTAQVILFDLASQATPQAWSPNTWKTRFVLNYKHIPYRTEFVHFPDVGSTLERAGVRPTRFTEPTHTVPSIIDSRVDTSQSIKLSDSVVIAEHLESTNPEPSLFPGGEAGLQDQRALQKLIWDCVHNRMGPIGIPATLDVLDERDKEYFLRTRKAIIGQSVEEMINSSTSEQKWAHLEAGLDEVARIIDERAGGAAAAQAHTWPFGHTQPVYADFVLCSMFMRMIIVGPAGTWERVKARNDGKWARLYDSCEPYMQVV